MPQSRGGDGSETMANANAAVAGDPQDDLAPGSNTPLTEREAADGIESLLGDDLLIADPAHKDGDDEEPHEPDPLGEDEEDAEENADTEDDGSPEPGTAGKYVASNAKYKLSDGTEITVGELARNNLFQRDYSKKTEEVAREREVVTQEKAEIAQVSQKLREEREFLIWYAEQNIPKPPAFPSVPASQDPMAHLQYAEDKRRYDVMAESWRAFKAGQAQDEQRKTGETQAEAQKRAATEVAALFDAIPVLKDQKKATAFFDALEKGAAEHYKLTQNQIADALKTDHRYGLILRDALAYRRAKAQAPAVQKELAAKPRLVRSGGQRSDPGQQVRRSIQKTTERLRQTGSMADGISAIEQLL